MRGQACLSRFGKGQGTLCELCSPTRQSCNFTGEFTRRGGLEMSGVPVEPSCVEMPDISNHKFRVIIFR